MRRWFRSLLTHSHSFLTSLQRRWKKTTHRLRWRRPSQDRPASQEESTPRSPLQRLTQLSEEDFRLVRALIVGHTCRSISLRTEVPLDTVRARRTALFHRLRVQSRAALRATYAAHLADAQYVFTTQSTPHGHSRPQHA